MCWFRNKSFIKEESSGKDLIIYCYPTKDEWNPELFEKKGFGGSEEAVIHLSRELAELGWNVTVYNNCGKPRKYGNVEYKPFWMWNYRDKQDVAIIWRSPKALDYDINADKIIIDVHDTVPEGEFNEKRLAKIDKIFVKTQFHRSLYPNIPDEKFAIVPNGIDLSLFEEEIEKDQYLMVNTSSPDRSMGVLPELFERVKKEVPEARLVWVYGWNIFDIAHADSSVRMEWKENTQEAIKHAGIEDKGRVTQKEAAELYKKANILAYPSEFAEIDCISVKKAQAAGCIPITTDFGALDESVQHGVKIHSSKDKDTWCKPNQFDFSLEGEKEKDEWVKACVKQLQTPIEDRSEMKEWTKKFSWDKIAKLWHNEL